MTEIPDTARPELSDTIAADTRRAQREGMGPGRAVLRSGGPTIRIPVAFARRAAELRRRRAEVERQHQERLRRPIRLRMQLQDRWGLERPAGTVMSLGDLPQTFVDWVLDRGVDDLCWRPCVVDAAAARDATAEDHARLDAAQRA